METVPCGFPPEAAKREDRMRRMTGFGWIRMAVYLLLGITAIIYGLFVRCAATGSDFYRIWIVGWIVFLMMAVCVPLGVWGRVPGWVSVVSDSVLAHLRVK